MERDIEQITIEAVLSRLQDGQLGAFLAAVTEKILCLQHVHHTVCRPASSQKLLNAQCGTILRREQAILPVGDGDDGEFLNRIEQPEQWSDVHPYSQDLGLGAVLAGQGNNLLLPHGSAEIDAMYMPDLAGIPYKRRSTRRATRQGLLQ